MNVLEKIRADLRAKLDKQGEAKSKVDEILAAAEARDDSTLTEDETVAFNEARDAYKALKGDVEVLEGRLADIEELNESDEAREALAKRIQPEPTPEGQRQYRVKNDEPTYREGGKHSFFQDAYNARFGGGHGEISERLNRHANEVRLGVHGEFRDLSTSAFGDGLVIPQYLPEKFAENLRAGRVTANLCAHEDLPDEGMTLTIPRGTTATVVESQSAQNDAVTEVDFDETDLVIPVRTLAGQQDMSRQSIERGRGTDTIIYRDLGGAYSVKLDTQILNGAGTNGTHTGILSTTTVGSVTTGTATGRSVLAKIAQGIATVAGARFMAPDVIIMHPRRWGWLTALSDSNDRPLVVVTKNGPQNARGTVDNAGYGYVGDLQGLPVYTDGNMPTTISTSTITGATEDNIIIAKSDDLLLWEDGVAPRQFRFEETLGGNLTVKLVVAGYSAFTAYWKPSGVAVISGSGMTTPVYPT